MTRVKKGKGPLWIRIVSSWMSSFMTTILLFGVLSSFLCVKYGISPFDIVSDMNILRQEINMSIVAPNGYSAFDIGSVKEATNKAVPNLIVGDDESGYSIGSSFVVNMKDEIRLTDTQVGALLNELISSYDSMYVKVDDKVINLFDYGFHIEQVKFENATGDSVDFNVVIKLDLRNFKKSLPLLTRTVSGLVPNEVCVSSTVTLEKTDFAFGYTVESKSFKINSLNEKESVKVYKLLNVFMSTGDNNSFNKMIGQTMLDELIGYKGNAGFAYSLYNKYNPERGATGFSFDCIDDVNYFVISNN